MSTGLPEAGENLIPYEELVARARRGGVKFGKGDPYNRLRYYTKIGLLPHAKRKSFHGANPSGAYPEYVVDLLVEIDNKLQAGKNIQAILREQKEEMGQREKTRGFPPYAITPVTTYKTSPPQPSLPSYPYQPSPEKGPPPLPETMDHRPRTTDHGLSAVDRGLSTVDRRPSTVDRREIGPIHYLAAFLLVALFNLPLIYLTSPPFRNLLKDTLPAGRQVFVALTPWGSSQEAVKLTLPSPADRVLGTITNPYLTINVETDINQLVHAKAGIKTHDTDVDAGAGNVYASNIIYGVQAGTNVAIGGEPQKPTISVPYVGNGDITAVLAGSGLSGGSYSGSATLSVNLQGGSGMDVAAAGLSITRGCGNGQLLKWNIVGQWECQNDTGGASYWDDIGAYIEPNTIGANEFRLYDSGGLTIGGTSDPGSNNLAVTGIITANTDETINGIDINAGTVTDVANLTINAGGDLTVGAIGLSDAGTNNTTSGANLVGVYDEFTNSNNTVLQAVLKDFDTAMGGGASKWTINATPTPDVIYPTLSNSPAGIDVAFGGTDSTAPFYMDVSTGELTLGNNQTPTSGSLKLYETATTPTEYGTLKIDDLGANRTYTFPNRNEDATVCVLSGGTSNCAGGGGGGGIGGGGALNRIAKFTPDGNNIGNSQLFDDGAKVGLATTTPSAIFDVYGNSGVSTTSSDINSLGDSGTGNITVGSTTGFPASGTVVVDSEAMFYTVVDGVTLNITTRGRLGTTGATHTNGSTLSFLETLVSKGITTTPHFTITSAGSIGIGDTTPAALLTVGNGDKFQVDSSGNVAATTINKVTITAPATGSTLTIADGKILTISNTLTFSGTDASSLNIGTGGTLAAMAFKANVTESDLSLSDNTTADVSITKHGFAPKAPNDTAKFLRGDGTWATISGATPTLQNAYDNDDDGSTAEILMTAADGSIIFKNIAATQFAVKMADTTAPTIDLMNILNTGASQGTTTNGVDGLQIDFLQADDADATDINAALNLNVIGDSDNADTLYGINVANLGGASAAATSTAINIGSGWDYAVSINSGALTLNSNAVGSSGAITLTAGATNLNLQPNGSIDVNIAGGSGATGCTVFNTTGNLTCSGTISDVGGPLTNYWQRASATLSPATANDVVSISFTSAPTIDFLTLSNSGQGVAISDGIDALSLTYAQAANAANISGSGINISLSPSNDAGDTIRGINLNNLSASGGTVQALNIGTMTDTGATSTAINIDYGWDNLISNTNFSVTGGGLVTYAANGTADNNAYVCKNSSNQLATCSVGGGTGGFVQLQPNSPGQSTINNGNSLIWLNENQASAPNLLELEVATNDRFVVANSGALTITAPNASSPNILLGRVQSDTTEYITLHLDASQRGLITLQGDDEGTLRFTPNGIEPASDGQLIEVLIGDNNATAFVIEDRTGLNEAARLDYLKFNTTDGSENISFGNTTTNPSYSFLGRGGVTINSVNAADNGQNALTLTGTLGAMNGSDTFRGLYLNYINADHTLSSNVFNGIDITGIIQDNQATETAINIGSGWDQAFVTTSAPLASATSSLVQLGSALVGGSANGTYIGINTTAGYSGDFLNFQVNDSSRFKVEADGDIVTSGDLAVNGGDITTTSSTLNIDVASGGVVNFRDGSTAFFTMSDFSDRVGADVTMTILSDNTGGSGFDITLATISTSGFNNGVRINASGSSTRNYLLKIDGSGGAVTDGILFTQTDSTMTDAIDASAANITNALNAGGNFVLFDDDNDGSGIREFSSAEGVLTWEDTSGNDLCTLTDNSDVGDLACTGNITGPAIGTVGYWRRSGTTLSPATANDVVSISFTSPPTLDFLTLSNTGQGTTTNNVDALSASIFTATEAGANNSALHAIIGNAPVDASDVINGLEVTGIAQTVASSTQNLIFLDPAASGNTLGTINGINIDSITTPNSAIETAINIGSGWDYQILFSGTGATDIVSTANATSANSNALTIQTGTSTTTGTTGAITLQTGNSGTGAGVSGGITIQTGTTATTGTNSGSISLLTGNATVSTGIAGSISLDVGTSAGSGAPAINIGYSTNSPAKTITIGGSSETGTITLGQSTASNTIYVGNGAVTGTQTINIGTAATGAGIEAITIGKDINTSSLSLDAGTGNISIGTGTTSAAKTITIGATGETGTITLGQSTATNTISIGSANPAASATQTINIGYGSQSNASSVIAVNILSGTAGTNGTATLSLGNNDRVTQIDLGNVAADAARTLNIGSGANIVGIDTINIGTGNTTVAGGKTIHIGDGTPSGSGYNSITIGSIANVASTTAIQGGNGTTAITLTPQTTGSITIGAAAGTGTITLGQSTAGQTINIGTGTGADRINIGTGNTNADTIIFGNGSSGVATSVTFNSGATTTNVVRIVGQYLTTGYALDIDTGGGTATGNGISVTTWTPQGGIGYSNDFLIKDASDTAGDVGGLSIRWWPYGSNAATRNVAKIQVIENTQSDASPITAGLLIDNADTSVTNSTYLANALKITNSGNIAGGITNAINITDLEGSASAMTGINIDTLNSPGAGTETAINIGSRWDTAINVSDSAATTNTLVKITNTGTVLTTAGANVGSLFDVNTTGAITAFTGNLVNISMASASNANNTGSLLNINDAGAANLTKLLTMNSSSTTNTTSLMSLTSVTAGTIANGIVRFNFNGNRTTAGTGFQIDDISTTLATVMAINGTSLTTGKAFAITLGSSLTTAGTTTGSGINVSGASFNHTAAETGNVASITFTDTTNLNSNTTTTTNGINLSSTINVTGGGSSNGVKTINPINVAAPTLTACTAQAGQTCVWNGLNINGATNNISTITENGINIATITGGTSAETAINIGSGWDASLWLQGATSNIYACPMVPGNCDTTLGSNATVVIKNPDTNNVANLQVEGRGAFGAGASINPNYTLFVSDTYTSLGGASPATIRGLITAKLASNSTDAFFGVSGRAETDSTLAFDVTQLTGGSFVASHKGTAGNVTHAIGVISMAENSGSGTIGNAYAFFAKNSTGGGSIGSSHGLYIESMTSATNNYGVYVENITAGTNDYGLYVAGAKTAGIYDTIQSISSGTTKGIDLNTNGNFSGVTVTALDIGTINDTAATSTAINIGSGWDNEINFGDTSPTIAIANTGTLSFTDGTHNLLSIIDNDTVGDLNVTGVYKQGGTPGVGITCSAGAPLVNGVFNGGIFTSGSCGGASSGTGVALAPVSADANATANPSIWINNTSTGGFFRFQNSGVDKLVVDNTGALTASGTITGNDFICTSGDCLDFTEFVDAMTIDAATTISYTGAGTGLSYTLSGAQTLASTALSISNTATSGTNSINKYGLSITSTGVWNGTSANNYALYIADATGGTNNYPIYQAGTTGSNVFGAPLLPLTAPSATSITQGSSNLVAVAYTGNQGLASAIGTDGFPVVGYGNNSDGHVRITHCGNTSCSSGNATTQVATSDMGQDPSMAIGSDGFPVMSYVNTVDKTLRVVKCANTSCSSFFGPYTVDSDVSIDLRWSSIAIGRDTYPIISYYLGATLKVAHCTSTSCASGYNITPLDGTTAAVGTSIAIGTDSLPIISYYDSSLDLVVIKCGNTSCSSGNTSTIDSTGDVGAWSSMAIGTDGLPIIAYYDATNTNLKIAKCNNPTCSASTLTTVSSANDIGKWATLAIGKDGLPLIAYFDETSDQVYAIKCGDTSCPSAGKLLVSSTTSTYRKVALAIGSDGLPGIAYHDGAPPFYPEFFQCGTQDCSASDYKLSGGVDLGSQSSYWEDIYAARFWGKSFQITGFDIAEAYKVTDGSIGAGDLVSLSPAGGLVVEKSAGVPYDSKVVGVISTDPGIKLSEWEETADTRHVALAGRVPVKVSTENGAIAVGDPLTSSSTPGVAMKATQSGPIVGKALEAFACSQSTDYGPQPAVDGGQSPVDSCYGKIMVFVSVGWFVQPVTSDQSPVTSIDVETLTAGTVNTQVLFVGTHKLSLAEDGSLLIDGKVQIAGDLKVDGKIMGKELEVEKINIATPAATPDGKNHASLGTAKIVSGETSVVIETTAVNADSKVFVTPVTKTDKVLSVTTKVDKTSFTVEATSSATTDIEFNWWVVN